MKNNESIKCRAAFERLVAHIRGCYSMVANLTVLDKGFDAAMNYIAGSDDNHACRLLRNLEVAWDLALLQCRTSVLACAILLDVPRAVVRALQLKGVSEVLAAYDALYHHNAHPGDANQLSGHLYHAVQLCCAKVHRDLQAKSDVQEHDCAFIRNVLIPAAESMKMRYHVNLLRNDCFAKNLWDEQKYSFTDVTSHIQALKTVGTSAYNAFDQLLLDALAKHPWFSLLSETGDAQEDDGMLRRGTSCWDVKEQMVKAGNTDRCALDLWEVTLSYGGDDEAAITCDYIAFHREHLSDALALEYVAQEAHCVTFRLTDTLENHYLLRLIPRSKLRSYYLGQECDGDFAHLLYHNNTNTPSITVYTLEEDRYRKIIVPSGATILDLAFYVSPTDAVMIQGARIRQMVTQKPPVFNNTDHRYPLHTALRDNDVVSFDVSADNGGTYKSSASIDWFAAINTDYAKACLIKYLREQYSGQL